MIQSACSRETLRRKLRRARVVSSGVAEACGRDALEVSEEESLIESLEHVSALGWSALEVVDYQLVEDLASVGLADLCARKERSVRAVETKEEEDGPNPLA